MQSEDDEGAVAGDGGKAGEQQWGPDRNPLSAVECSVCMCRAVQVRNKARSSKAAKP